MLALVALLMLVTGNGFSAFEGSQFFSSKNTFFILVQASLAQFALGMLLDSRYEKNLWKIYLRIIWYPFVYWVVIALATFVGFPKALFKKKGQRAIWTSPDRGFKL
jgi:biofilm PGA synthesis N-glycosyltransferase PgaC